MDKQLLRDWLNHPVSRIFVDLLAEHKAACEQLYLNTEAEANTVGVLNKIKGQINTFEMLVDLEEFLHERLTKEEVNEEDDEENA